MLSSSKSNKTRHRAHVPGAVKRCNVGKVIAHAKTVSDSPPSLKVKLEGPKNVCEWNFEYVRVVFPWDVSYRHYIDKKLALNGAISEDVKSYYRGVKRNKLKELASAIDRALQSTILGNLDESKLHFHATPDGNHTYEDLRDQINKACTRDTLMTKVGELRYAKRSQNSPREATLKSMIYGNTDWRLQVIACIADLDTSDDHLMRKVLKAVGESDLNEEFDLITSRANSKSVQKRVNQVIRKLVGLVEHTLNNEQDGRARVSLELVEPLMRSVRKRFVDAIQEKAKPQNGSDLNDESATSSTSAKFVACEFKWSADFNFHIVNDSSLLHDRRQQFLTLYDGCQPRWATVGSLRVQFQGGERAVLDNAVYLADSPPIFSGIAAAEDGVHLTMRQRGLILQKTGEKLCDHGERDGWYFDLKIERACSPGAYLIVSSIEPSSASLEDVKSHEIDYDGNDQGLPEVQGRLKTQFNLHRKYGHPVAREFIRLQENPDDDPFPSDYCRACRISRPMLQIPDDMYKFSTTSRPLESTHISIHEGFKSAYDGSRYILTIVDEHTKLTTVFNLSNKAQAMLRIDTYFRTNGVIFKWFNFRICHDNDPVLGPQIDDFCEFHRFSLRRTKSIADRWGKVIIDKARCLLTDAHVPTIFWPAAVRQAVNQLNSFPVGLLGSEIPYKKWQSFTNIILPVPKLAVFGSFVSCKDDMVEHLGCYLGPSPSNTRHLVLSHDIAKIVEVDTFVEKDGFFFKTYRLEAGPRADSRDVDVLKTLIQPPLSNPQTFAIKGESAKDLEIEQSVLEEVFSNEHWRSHELFSRVDLLLMTPDSEDLFEF